jgi:putative flippase GtrA
MRARGTLTDRPDAPAQVLPPPAQAIAIILVTPLNFLGNKLWSFRH